MSCCVHGISYQPNQDMITQKSKSDDEVIFELLCQHMVGLPALQIITNKKTVVGQEKLLLLPIKKLYHFAELRTYALGILISGKNQQISGIFLPEPV